MVKNIEQHKWGWKNTDNIDWYENIPVNSLRELAIKGGLESGCDIDLIYPYIENSSNLIEIGAGYGRAIKRIVDKGYKGAIHALERSEKFAKYLASSFPQINIIKQSIINYAPPIKFDAIIAVWSFIAEFPIEEQGALVSNLSSWLSDHGILIVEILATKPMNATDSIDSFYEIDTAYGKVWGHMPKHHEILEYAKHAGLNLVKVIPYYTLTNRERSLYIFSR